MNNKRGQLSIVIILALIIVAGVIAFFAVRGEFFMENVPAEFRPVYNSYEGCIAAEIEIALGIAGMQGGRIYVDNVDVGSSYAPFSSELNFLGTNVPYWFYMAGNGLVKEQVPTQREIEGDIGRFIEENVNNCDFEDYYKQGFYIEMGEPKASVSISEGSVDVELKSSLVVRRDDGSARKTTHEVSVNSRFGKLYEEAKRIYLKQRDDMFLENHAIDVLNLYAPVNGVELSCSPKVWRVGEVVEDLESGLEANIGALKMNGNYYTLDKKEDKYFVIDEDVEFPVRFLYSRDWPAKVEVTPSGKELMIAKPVGMQEGMGVIGFCYVPYHFVWDVRFPVMVQLGDGIDEFFQFPVVVMIDNNAPREVDLSNLQIELFDEEKFDLCEFKEGDVQVRVFNSNLNPVKANVSYQCFNQLCDLGETEIIGDEEILMGKIPVCVNGYLIVESGGYSQEKELFSSNSESSADVILDREYLVEVDILIDGNKLSSSMSAIVHFNSEDVVASVLLPEMNEVSLKEGDYDVEVYVYSNSSIKIPSSTTVECVEVSRGGLAGIFGVTKEQCFDIEIPAMDIDYALVGGGSGGAYILEDELEKGKLVLHVGALSRPVSVEDLQNNYADFENLGVYVEVRDD